MPTFYTEDAVIDVLKSNNLEEFVEMLDNDRVTQQRRPGRYTHFLEQVVNLNGVNLPVLFHVLKTGSAEMVAKVLPLDAQYNFIAGLRDRDGKTLLNYLPSNTYQHVTQEQVEQIVDGLLTEYPEMFREGDNYGRMPLENAVRNSNVLLTTKLLRHFIAAKATGSTHAGTIENVLTPRGDSLLAVAKEKRDFKIAQMLYLCGAQFAKEYDDKGSLSRSYGEVFSDDSADVIYDELFGKAPAQAIDREVFTDLEKFKVFSRENPEYWEAALEDMLEGTANVERFSVGLFLSTVRDENVTQYDHAENIAAADALIQRIWGHSLAQQHLKELDKDVHPLQHKLHKKREDFWRLITSRKFAGWDTMLTLGGFVTTLTFLGMEIRKHDVNRDNMLKYLRDGWEDCIETGICLTLPHMTNCPNWYSDNSKKAFNGFYEECHEDAVKLVFSTLGEILIILMYVGVANDELEGCFIRYIVDSPFCLATMVVGDIQEPEFENKAELIDGLETVFELIEVQNYTDSIPGFTEKRNRLRYDKNRITTSDLKGLLFDACSFLTKYKHNLKYVNESFEIDTESINAVAATFPEASLPTPPATRRTVRISLNTTDEGASLLADENRDIELGEGSNSRPAGFGTFG